MAKNTRDRILRALREVIAGGGTDAVTLDAVAAAAGVSKGGLLYHFPSKAALYTGLLESTRASVVDEMGQATARSGAVRGFLEYSEPTSTDEVETFTSLIAAVRGGQREQALADEDGSGNAGRLLVEIFQEWEDPMLAQVSDPVQAQIIRLVGYGLYLGNLVGLPPLPEELREAVFNRATQGVVDATRPTAARTPSRQESAG